MWIPRTWVNTRWACQLTEGKLAGYTTQDWEPWDLASVYKVACHHRGRRLASTCTCTHMSPTHMRSMHAHTHTHTHTQVHTLVHRKQLSLDHVPLHRALGQACGVGSTYGWCFLKSLSLGLERDGSAVKSTDCSSRGPEFNS